MAFLHSCFPSAETVKHHSTCENLSVSIGFLLQRATHARSIFNSCPHHVQITKENDDLVHNVNNHNHLIKYKHSIYTTISLSLEEISARTIGISKTQITNITFQILTYVTDTSKLQYNQTADLNSANHLLCDNVGCDKNVPWFLLCQCRSCGLNEWTLVLWFQLERANLKEQPLLE